MIAESPVYQAMTWARLYNGVMGTHIDHLRWADMAGEMGPLEYAELTAILLGDGHTG